MKRPESSSYNEWMDQRVEAFVDGDLPEEERERFEQHLSDDAYWREQVRQARRIQTSLHELTLPSTPSDLTQSILNHTSRAATKGAHNGAPQPLSWWKDWLQNAVHTWRALVSARQRPVVDYAVGLALVAVGVFFIVVPINDAPSPPSQNASQLNAPVTAPYSAEDVERAETKVKWTFDYLSTLSDDASTSIEASVRKALLDDSSAVAPDASAPDAPAPDAPRTGETNAEETNPEDTTSKETTSKETTSQETTPEETSAAPTGDANASSAPASSSNR